MGSEGSPSGRAGLDDGLSGGVSLHQHAVSHSEGLLPYPRVPRCACVLRVCLKHFEIVLIRIKLSQRISLVAFIERLARELPGWFTR